MDTTWADNLKELDRLMAYRDELLKMLVDAENDLRNYRAALKAARRASGPGWQTGSSNASCPRCINAPPTG